MSSETLFLAIGAGMLAGFINTLAGSGSLITLPMLIFLGLPLSVANGTNRIGILLQNVVGLIQFRRHGKLTLPHSGWLLLPIVLGALVGSLIAVDLNEQLMRYAIGMAMIVMLICIVLRPQQWLREQAESTSRMQRMSTGLLFFVIGVYGGFIQAGVGVFLLAALVMHCGLPLLQANGMKLGIIAIFSVPALALFVLHDQVDWYLGSAMAVGQGLGAWLAASFAANNQHATIWMRRLLILVINISIVKLFGLWDLLLMW